MVIVCEVESESTEIIVQLLLIPIGYFFGRISSPIYYIQKLGFNVRPILTFFVGLFYIAIIQNRSCIDNSTDHNLVINTFYMAVTQYFLVSWLCKYKIIAFTFPLCYTLNNLVNSRQEIYSLISPIYSIQIITCLRCISWGMDRLNSANLTVIENNDYMTAYTFNGLEIFAFMDYISYIFNFIGIGTHLFYPFHIHHRYLYQHAKSINATNSWPLILDKLFYSTLYSLIYIIYKSTIMDITILNIIFKMWCLWYVTEMSCILSGCTNECDMEPLNQWIWCKNCDKWMVTNLLSIHRLYLKWNISIHKFLNKYIYQELSCINHGLQFIKHMFVTITYFLLYGFDIDIRFMFVFMVLLIIEKCILNLNNYDKHDTKKRYTYTIPFY